MLKEGNNATLSQQIDLTVRMSMPSIMAQISAVVMQYIDAAMVGRLGAKSSAAIGLVSTSTWLFWGLCTSIVSGFAVLVSHNVGAGKIEEATNILRRSLPVVLAFSLLLSVAGLILASPLPLLLGGQPDVAELSTQYFSIFSLALPALAMVFFSGAMLRSSGNFVIPGILNISMCVMDVIFNFFFIYPSRIIHSGSISINIPGADMGVSGAALGTAVAEIITAILMFGYLYFRSETFLLKEYKASWKPDWVIIKTALKISLPVGCEKTMMSMAAIVITAIIAPLGNVALAADTFAITAESLCYMPGYGISDAASTIVGQCIGAGRRNLAKRFAKISVCCGISIMTLTGIILFAASRQMMNLLTPVDEIAELGSRILKIEAFAEPMFGAAIVCYGVFVGAKDAFTPAAMNLFSIWVVRISACAIMAPIYGLTGVWIAMSGELCFRGIIFLLRFRSVRWLKINKN